MYFYRARYYDAITSRFINEDPIGFDGGDFNLFRYTQNNPINLVDPFGLEMKPFPLPPFADQIAGQAAGSIVNSFTKNLEGSARRVLKAATAGGTSGAIVVFNCKSSFI